jgi:hypothetical protein
MTASEFAFLALGLVLGVASGAALVMVLGSRPPARGVKLTTERDAVPRRGATLSSDAFVTATAEPARGGPADRRRLDRDVPPEDPPFTLPMSVNSAGLRPAPHRTIVSFEAPAMASAGFPIQPERDPALDIVRVQAALAAARLYRTGLPTATALLESRGRGLAQPEPEAANLASPLPSITAYPDGEVAAAPALVRILRGDHQALFATAAALGGPDMAERRNWHAALMALAGQLAERAIQDGWLDVPVGNPFWDTFTLAQCRTIAAALATTGHRFDAVDGWADGRIPTYRELTLAVASAGLEPRRVRAWPTQEEIGALYREVTVATDDYLATHAPSLDLEEVQDLVAETGPSVDRLWLAWDRVRATLLAPVAEAAG